MTERRKVSFAEISPRGMLQHQQTIPTATHEELRLEHARRHRSAVSSCNFPGISFPGISGDNHYSILLHEGKKGKPIQSNVHYSSSEAALAKLTTFIVHCCKGSCNTRVSALVSRLETMEAGSTRCAAEAKSVIARLVQIAEAQEQYPNNLTVPGMVEKSSALTTNQSSELVEEHRPINSGYASPRSSEARRYTVDKLVTSQAQQSVLPKEAEVDEDASVEAEVTKRLLRIVAACRGEG